VWCLDVELSDVGLLYAQKARMLVLLRRSQKCESEVCGWKILSGRLGSSAECEAVSGESEGADHASAS
jgi:hypothetical protein